MRPTRTVSSDDPSYLPSIASVPLAQDEVDAAAVRAGIVIPDLCARGVAANLALLATHAERMRGAA